jgi:hypothetical protein
VLPWTAGVAAPPNWDRSYTECFGFTVEDLGEAGARSLDQKLRAVGLPLDDGVPGLPWRNELEPRERAERGMRLLKANYIGPGGPLDRDPGRHPPRPGRHDDPVGLHRLRPVVHHARQRLVGGDAGPRVEA